MKSTLTVTIALLVTIALPVALAPTALAGDAPGRVLSLDEAIRVALENNETLLADRAGVDAADAAVDAASAARRPILGLDLATSRTTNPVLVFGELLGQERFAEANFDTAFLNEPDPLTNSTARVTAHQVLWSGGRLAAEVSALRAARAATVAATERTRQRVIHEVVAAYADAVLAGARLEVAVEARATAREHARIAEDLHAAGLVVKSDVLQARVREREIDELIVLAETGVEIGRARLELAVGNDLGPGTKLPRSFESAIQDDADPAAGGLAALLDEARRGRPDLATAAQRIRAAEDGLRRARAGRAPEVGVSAAWEANAEGAPGIDGSNWTVLVAARVPLYEGGAIAAHTRRAEAERRQSEWIRSRLDRALELEVRQADASLRAARARVALSDASRDMAHESLRIVRDRYEQGLATLAELLDAETALTRARTGGVTARRDVLVARAALDLALGRR